MTAHLASEDPAPMALDPGLNPDHSTTEVCDLPLMEAAMDPLTTISTMDPSAADPVVPLEDVGDGGAVEVLEAVVVFEMDPQEDLMVPLEEEMVPEDALVNLPSVLIGMDGINHHGAEEAVVVVEAVDSTEVAVVLAMKALEAEAAIAEEDLAKEVTDLAIATEEIGIVIATMIATTAMTTIVIAITIVITAMIAIIATPITVMPIMIGAIKSEVPIATLSVGNDENVSVRADGANGALKLRLINLLYWHHLLLKRVFRLLKYQSDNQQNLVIKRSLYYNNLSLFNSRNKFNLNLNPKFLSSRTWKWPQNNLKQTLSPLL